MSHLTILRQYAQKRDPSSLPPNILFRHNDKFITVFDAFPKAKFHFLILPRIQHGAEVSVFDLASLRTLLKLKEREQAKGVIDGLAAEAKEVKQSIEQEMLDLYGFTWDIWIGFHAVPSMTHLHLHVISGDLFSERLKTKKHFNSFHPKLGFFLHLSDVLSWFDAEPSHYAKMASLSESKYEPLLKEPMTCWRCNVPLKNMPAVSTHLKNDWDKASELAQAASRKRKLECADDVKAKHKKSKVEKPLGNP